MSHRVCVCARTVKRISWELVI